MAPSLIVELIENAPTNIQDGRVLSSYFSLVLHKFFISVAKNVNWQTFSGVCSIVVENRISELWYRNGGWPG